MIVFYCIVTVVIKMHFNVTFWGQIAMKQETGYFTETCYVGQVTIIHYTKGFIQRK